MIKRIVLVVRDCINKLFPIVLGIISIPVSILITNDLIRESLWKLTTTNYLLLFGIVYIFSYLLVAMGLGVVGLVGMIMSVGYDLVKMFIDFIKDRWRYYGSKV